MLDFFKKKLKDLKTKHEFSYLKSTEYKNAISSIYKLINFQIKLVDVILKREKNLYDKKSKKLLSMLDSEWVLGYVIDLARAYLKEAPNLKKKTLINLYAPRDILVMLNVKNTSDSSIYEKLIMDSWEYSADYILKKNSKERHVDFMEGCHSAIDDYKNFLKLSIDNKKINKILPCMNLAQYLCSKLDIPLIDEFNDSDGDSFFINKK
jgi:hypothetical protein